MFFLSAFPSRPDGTSLFCVKATISLFSVPLEPSVVTFLTPELLPGIPASLPATALSQTELLIVLPNYSPKRW